MAANGARPSSAARDDSSPDDTNPADKSSGRAVTRSSQSSTLATDHGNTSIADVVVSKIAGIATRQVDGVHDLGGGTSRAVGQLRQRIPGANVSLSQGVSVEVGERQTAVDVDIVVEYGTSIADLAAGIRRNVIASVERMTGLEVTEVNITVRDVHIDDEETPDDRDDERVARVE